ncbi:hypothetical protein FDK38_002720 [Candidozyma auris]|nr:hypothetical protein FDK38_002720 [[Candida] auris]
MGQTFSHDNTDEAAKVLVLESFTKEKITRFFQLRCVHLLSPEELSTLTSSLDLTSANDRETAISYAQVAHLLHLANDVTELSISCNEAIKLLADTFTVLGSLPFLRDSVENVEWPLTLKGLLIASAVFSGRIRRLLGHKYDYLKLLYIAFATSSSRANPSPEEKSESDPEKSSSPSGDDEFVMEAVRPPPDREDKLDDTLTARRIKWDTCATIKSYDEIDINSLQLRVSDFAKILAILLIVGSVPKKSHRDMQAQVQQSLKEKWTSFEEAAYSVLKYFDLDVDKINAKQISVSYEAFRTGCKNGIGSFIIDTLAKLVNGSIFSSITSDGKVEAGDKPPSTEESPKSPSKTRTSRKFEKSRLINEPSIALISLALRNAGSRHTVDTANLVQLYNGSQSGFSIRSLEQKIFKWHAPTVFLVSGKRLKQKTINTNRRYQQFDQEYPRYFLANENSQKDWQANNDVLTYAVFVHSPWKSSNKKNFGDEEAVVISLSPHFDYYKTKPDPVLQGKSTYFSNLGMGIGFGNDQPVNKNTIRKYLPGNVSLTIEANLEFAIFRHISNGGPHTTSYFEKSTQERLHDEDFEDRFMITDIEVWGVGSNKELDEQRKQWEWEEKQAKARQSVNLRNTGEERAFLEMAGLVGNHGSGGSI